MDEHQETSRLTERSRGSTLGMIVLSIQEGAALGQIKQLLLDSKTYRIQAFVVEKRRVGKEDKLLPFSAIHSFGEDSVTVETHSVLERKGANHQYVRALRQPLPIIGARVFTENGKSLGKVEEYRFSTLDGSISALELSGGLLKEKMLVPGKSIIAIAPQTIMLKDAAIDEAVHIDSPLRSGMENAAGAVKERAANLKNTTVDTTKKLSANFNDAMKTLWDRNAGEDDSPLEAEADAAVPLPEESAADAATEKEEENVKANVEVDIDVDEEKEKETAPL